MPYEKQNFVDGEFVFASQLNHIEDGVDYATQTAESAKDYVYHPPIIGENGNWWEWDGEAYVDTGKPSRGEQGIQGEKGEPGEAGPQGEQGHKGDPGELTVRQGNAIYSNVLKGTASGATVRLDGVSPLEHTVPVKVNGADDTTVVKVQGKNLVNPSAYVKDSSNTSVDGDVFTTNFTNAGTFVNTGWTGRQVKHPKGTYTLSFVPVSDGACASAYVYAVEGSTSSSSKRTIALIYNIGKDGVDNLTFTANEDFFISLGGAVAASDRGTHSYKLQLEIGNTSTAYEPYMEPVSYPVQPVYGDNIFDVQAIDSADIYTTKVNGEDAFCTFVESTELPVHFEPSTQYVISFEVACPSVPDGWRVSGSVFEVLYVEGMGGGSGSLTEVGFIGIPYNEFQKFEWVSPPGTSIDFLTFRQPTIEDSDGIEVSWTTAAIKTNMTIRPVSAECEVPSIYPAMTLTTDTAGAVLDCEYNRDINKAIEQLTQAIISMGGNI